LSAPFSRSVVRTTKLALSALALLCAGPAIATKPAVDVVNGALGGGYGYGEVASASVTSGGSTSDIPSEQIQGWVAAGRLTFPIVHRFGGRAFVTGGIDTIERDSIGTLPSTRSDGVYGRAGLDLFARDPEAGYFGLGYRFGLRDPVDPRAERDLTHGVSVDGGFFIPDQDLGPIDWRGSFEYGRGKLEGSGFRVDVNRYAASLSSGWYWTESLRFTGGFLWNREDPTTSGATRDLRGSADIAWLLPIGKVRYVTLRGEGTGGRRRSEVGSPATNATRPLWSVGGTLTFSFPGVESLVQLSRERE
jgi:hypothetical protein